MAYNRNIVANYFGAASIAIVQIAFVPVYLRYLGIEAYGLVGVYVSLQALLTVLDAGVSLTLTREFARYKAGSVDAGSIRNLLRTVEIFFLAGGLGAGAIGWFSAPFISTYWLRSESLSISTVECAVRVMGFLAVTRWWAGVYRSATAGLQDMVWLNATGVAFAALRAAGVIAVLEWIAPDIKAFFIFQALVSLAELWLVRRRVWQPLRLTGLGRFRPAELLPLWRFTAHLSVILVIVVIIMQADKIVLSKMLTLGDYGHYALASAVAGSIGLLMQPIASVAYPRFVELNARGERPDVVAAYHRYTQMVTITLAPCAAVLALFSHHILLLWVRDTAIVAISAPVLSLLAPGMMFFALLSIPNYLQLASGNARVLVVVYGVSLTLYIPSLLLGIASFGMLGAGCAVLGAGATIVAFGVFFMPGSSLSRRENWSWIVSDVLIPTLSSFIAATSVYLLTPLGDPAHPWVSFITVCLALSVAAVSALLSCSVGRQILRRLATA